jgi:hypothetical protein
MTVQVTNPYYRTAYALVFKQDMDWRAWTRWVDPRLKGLGVRSPTRIGNVSSIASFGRTNLPLTMLLSFGVPLFDDNDRVITENSIPK